MKMTKRNSLSIQGRGNTFFPPGTPGSVLGPILPHIQHVPMTWGKTDEV
jgi:hypothetical protein